MGGKTEAELKMIELQKRAEKRLLVQRVVESKRHIQPFFWNASLVKDDPIMVMDQEEILEKKKKNKPVVL